MRFFEISRFFSHTVLAAALTGFAFFAMPITGVLAKAPERNALEFHEFGSNGDDVEDVEFVWHDVTEGDVERILAGDAETAQAADGADRPTDGGTAHGKSPSKVLTSVPRGDVPRMLGGRERVVERVILTERQGAPVGSIPARKASGKCGEPIEEIRITGSGSWEVERDFVESYAGNVKAMNTLGAVGKHDGPDGKPDGFIVGRIRCGSPLHQGGLRNGDVVHSVNGHKVNNVVQAIGTYRKVRKDETVQLEVTRRNGKRLTLVYELY